MDESVKVVVAHEGREAATPPPLSIPSQVETNSRRAAATDIPVLITGETGTGKTVLARRIHGWSNRSSAAFVRVDCASVPEGIFESELFGHAKGSFTGASTGRSGLIRQADGGTLFLDELSVLSPKLQSRLLTVVEERKVRAVGRDRAVVVDVRLISATNQDLPSLAREGKFRWDLYHRCSPYIIRVPPLRRRKADWPAIVSRVVWQVLTGPLKELGLRRLEISARLIHE